MVAVRSYRFVTVGAGHCLSLRAVVRSSPMWPKKGGGQHVRCYPSAVPGVRAGSRRKRGRAREGGGPRERDFGAQPAGRGPGVACADQVHRDASDPGHNEPDRRRLTRPWRWRPAATSSMLLLGAAATFGYGGASYLGPTLLVKQGQSRSASRSRTTWARIRSPARSTPPSTERSRRTRQRRGRRCTCTAA